MPRRARIMLAGIPVHVVQRGNNRQACFYNDDDRGFYLFHLARFARRDGCAVHAYCLMTNHVHLLLTPRAADSCGMLMKDIGQLYARYANRRHKRTGTLWEGRFRSCLVQAEEYLFACHRYIELNPVRAGMCAKPADYLWSSHGANAFGAADAVVSPHEELRRLGRSEEERRAAYRELFSQELPASVIKEIRDATNGNVALGDKAFREKVSRLLGRRAERGAPGRPKKEKRGLSLFLELDPVAGS